VGVSWTKPYKNKNMRPQTATFLRHWLPAIIVMAAIFVFSSIPSYELPDFAWADTLIKKGGHMLGYGLLALAYWWGLRAACPACTCPAPNAGRCGTGTGGRQIKGQSESKGSVVEARYAWLLTVLYACTDEFHQLFVAGRHSSLVDIGIDALGAAVALAILWIILIRIPARAPRPRAIPPSVRSRFR